MPSYDFQYLIKKINDSLFSSSPFRHIYIENFLTDNHFNEIVNTPEVSPPIATDDAQLINNLQNSGFKIISFPGGITDKSEYIEWHQNERFIKNPMSCEGYGVPLGLCEGFGMVFRLEKFQSPILSALNSFITGHNFNQTIATKLGINLEECRIDGGIQKYLDGYEISPHPDIRLKAMTFMVNINPNYHSPSLDHHTHYMKLKNSYRYVQYLWEGNPGLERAWVPWDWAETDFQQTKNNSIVIFSPSNDTFHGVRANYNHLDGQRTQLYGNLWYINSNVHSKLEWKDLDLISSLPINTSQMS